MLRENSKGITLISLVVSIIVLIILVGVTFGFVLGENGLIAKAIEARRQNAIAKKREEVILAIHDETIEKQGDTKNISVESVVEKIKINYSKQAEKDSISAEEVLQEGEESNDRLPAKFVYNPPSSDIDETIIIEINEKGELSGTRIDKPEDHEPELDPLPSEYKQVGGIFYNSPDLSGFNKKHTYYINYDDSGNEEIVGRLDKVSAPENWHDYGNKKWANIMTLNDDGISYWVWIPRYKYLTKTSEEPNTAIPDQTVDAYFIDMQNKCYMWEESKGKYEVTKSEYGENFSLDNYKISDAFTFNGQALKGYWVSKYQIKDATIEDTITLKSTSPKKTEVSTVNNATGEFIIIINGNIVKTNATLPVSVDYRKESIEEIYLISSSDKKLISGVAKEWIEPNKIEVDLSGFNPDCTYYVEYDESGNEKDHKTKIKLDSNGDATNIPSGWYDYQNKKWANIMTLNGDSIAYWTYIPRYQYKVWPKGQSVDAVFISQSKTEPDPGFKIPESFTFNGKALKGYWISKYQLKDATLENSITIKATGNKTEVSTIDPVEGTFTVMINGEVKNVGVTFPVTVNMKKEDIHEIYLISDTTKNVISGIAKEWIEPNKIEVDLSGFNPDCTYYVEYDESGNEIENKTKIELGKNGNATNIPIGWYDYENKKWANIMTDNDGTIAYWTYIPRYQYRVWPKGQFVDAVFISQSKTEPDPGFKIPESFTFNGKALKGYWVSKYQVKQ